jgi:hypothetical protein
MNATSTCNASLAALLVLLFASQVPALEKSEIHDLFSRGKEHFRRANEIAATEPEAARASYRQAVMCFERISREGGIHNGRLFYNIGNAYFQLGDLGRAILNYRRAEDFIPDDPNLRQNLGYARSQRQDQIPERERTKILRTLFFWHYDFPARIRLAALVLLAATFWGAASIRLFARKTWALAWIFVSAPLALCFAASLAADSLARSNDPSAVIVEAEATARKGDGEAYQPAFREPLHAGTEVARIEERGRWCQVELNDGRRCWLPASAIEMVRPARE